MTLWHYIMSWYFINKMEKTRDLELEILFRVTLFQALFPFCLIDFKKNQKNHAIPCGKHVSWFGYILPNPARFQPFQQQCHFALTDHGGMHYWHRHRGMDISITNLTYVILNWILGEQISKKAQVFNLSDVTLLFKNILFQCFVVLHFNNQPST